FGLRYTAPPSCHTLPLHDALPIWLDARSIPAVAPVFDAALGVVGTERFWAALGGTLQSWGLGMLIASAVGISLGMIIGASPLLRSEEHTSELQSRENLVCRLLLEE